MLLQTHVEKMSECGLATMLMKTSQLHRSFHDVDDKKGTYEKTRIAIHPSHGVHAVAECTHLFGPLRAEKSPPGSREVFRPFGERRPDKSPSQASLTEPGEMADRLYDFDRDRHHARDSLRRFQQPIARNLHRLLVRIRLGRLR